MRGQSSASNIWLKMSLLKRSATAIPLRRRDSKLSWKRKMNA